MPDENPPIPGSPTSSYPLKPDLAGPGKAPHAAAGPNWAELPAHRRSRFSDFLALMGCNAIVFITSVCLMVLELTASRLIAGYVGQSLYTWTSVIGVVLAGISFGNYAGGWLADRYPPQKLLGWQFLVAGATTLLVLWLNKWAAETRQPKSLDWQWWVMIVVAWVFLLPALSLGTISPVVASMALRRSTRTGITVGNIYAWGAMGSIVGTFLAGFWLIGNFGTKEIVSMTAGVLVLMAAIVSGAQYALRATALFGVLQFITLVGLCASMTPQKCGAFVRKLAGVQSFWRTGAAWLDQDRIDLQAAIDAKKDDDTIQKLADRATWRLECKQSEEEWADWGRMLGAQLHRLGLTFALRSDEPGEYDDESDYYAINISPTQSNGDQVSQLRLDYLVHSYYNASNPTKLYYDYEKVYAAITERAAARWNRRNEAEIQRLPSLGDLEVQLPAGITYDPATRRLSLSGAMTYDQLRGLMRQGPFGEFREAILLMWEKADSGWSLAAQEGGGVMSTRLENPAPQIASLADQTSRIQYDPQTRLLTCTAPFLLDEALELMSQQDEGGWVRAVAALFRASRRTSAMFVGGGGFVFPRWIETRFPAAPTIDVAEIDPAVQKAVELKLGLATSFGPPTVGKTFVRTHIGDARKFVDDRLRANEASRQANQPPLTYDFVYGDAFNDLSVPWHLTTEQFSRKVRELMSPGEGLYLVNIIDIYPRARLPKGGLVDFEGLVPDAILPDGVNEKEFVAARGADENLAILKTANGHRLRYTGLMPKELREKLVKLDVGKDAPTKLRFSSAISELYDASKKPKVLTSAPPPELFPPYRDRFEWVAAAGEFGSLQVHSDATDGTWYTLGLRGVMSDEMRDKLLALPGATDEFREAIVHLQKQSRASVYGRFLGRYVATAREIFDYVYVFSSNEDEPSASRDTFVIACSLKKLDFDSLRDAGNHWSRGPFAWSEPASGGDSRDHGEMPAILELSRGLQLTDDFAPVDNLLAPVFANRLSDDE